MSENRKQCRRFDIEGDAHCLTFSCFRRLPLLSRRRSCDWMCGGLAAGRKKGLYELWAYVLMPEHGHIVLLPTKGVRISQILTAIKQSTAKRALHWLQEHSPAFLPQLLDGQPSGKKSYRFWQRGGGYDRNLRSLRDIFEKIDYIHANPVRRGLVDVASRWPWSSARAWETGCNDPITIDRTLPWLAQEL